MNKEALAYKNDILSPFKFKMGMLKNLPSVVFWGVKLEAIDEKSSIVSIPFSWRTQNPFKSIYFAALAGAGELATGSLCQLMLAGRVPHAMLVSDMSAEFVKKSSTKITFTCDQGEAIYALLEGLEKPGDTGKIKTVAIGRNTSNEVVGHIYITWSFKRKG